VEPSVGETADILPDSGITNNQPPETGLQASAAQAESAGLVHNEPLQVTASSASVAEASASSPEVSELEVPVTTAEAPQPEPPTIAAVNGGTSTPKSDSAEPVKDAVAMIDEKISRVEPASPVDTKTENVQPMAVEANGSQPTSEPHLNGYGPAPVAAFTKVETPSAPSTPAKKSPQPFPSSSHSNSPTKSHSSRVGSESRKKKTSIFGKVKHLFSHDKDKEKERK
jgi:hypothetical protein